MQHADTLKELQSKKQKSQKKQLFILLLHSHLILNAPRKNKGTRMFRIYPLHSGTGTLE